jgi:hypothetical protein
MRSLFVLTLCGLSTLGLWFGAPSTAQARPHRYRSSGYGGYSYRSYFPGNYAYYGSSSTATGAYYGAADSSIPGPASRSYPSYYQGASPDSGKSRFYDPNAGLYSRPGPPGSNDPLSVGVAAF